MKTFLMPILLAAVCFSLPSLADTSAPVPAPSATPLSRPTSVDKITYANLSPEEREIINRGPISTGAYVTGGVIGSVFGFGIGQAIQGRYMPTGLIITLGEAVSTGLLISGINNCVDNSLNGLFQDQPADNGNCLSGVGTAGLVGLIGFRIWELIDLWATPPSVNARYRAVQSHLETTTSMTVLPAFGQASDGVRSMDGLALAYQIRF